MALTSSGANPPSGAGWKIMGFIHSLTGPSSPCFLAPAPLTASATTLSAPPAAEALSLC